jgi:prolyl-tRNA synthetase
VFINSLIRRQLTKSIDKFQQCSIHFNRSRLFLPNSFSKKSDKADTPPTSALILEKNGFISEMNGSCGSGLTSLLPLGQRVVLKLKNIIRQEMDRIGGQEIELPALCDLSLWSKTGRDQLMGHELFKLKDRKSREMCLCPTHEEVVTNLFVHYSKSLTDQCLGSNPLLLYQVML